MTTAIRPSSPNSCRSRSMCLSDLYFVDDTALARRVAEAAARVERGRARELGPGIPVAAQHIRQQVERDRRAGLPAVVEDRRRHGGDSDDDVLVAERRRRSSASPRAARAPPPRRAATGASTARRSSRRSSRPRRSGARRRAARAAPRRRAAAACRRAGSRANVRALPVQPLDEHRLVAAPDARGAPSPSSGAQALEHGHRRRCARRSASAPSRRDARDRRPDGRARAGSRSRPARAPGACAASGRPSSAARRRARRAPLRSPRRARRAPRSRRTSSRPTASAGSASHRRASFLTMRTKDLRTSGALVTRLPTRNKPLSRSRASVIRHAPGTPRACRSLPPRGRRPGA